MGLTPNLATQRQLSLSWGVMPVLVTPFSDADDIFALVRSWVAEHDIARKGDRVIVTAGVPVGAPGSTNLLKVIEM
jgi:pyruvate kinase